MVRLSVFRRFSWLWLPVMLAIMARAVIAPGWMLDRGADGTITVLICSDITGTFQTVDIALESAGDHDGAASVQHCPWGALAASPPLPDAPQLASAPTAPTAHPAPPTPMGFAPGVASPLPPSTGPPAFA